MKPVFSYNRIAGTSVERLAALSDGIFAVAMTLLVLDLHVPARDTIADDTVLWRELIFLAPQLFVYLMSFITLGIFWVGQQAQLNCLERSDRNLTWIHLAFLFVATLLPFTTHLLAEYIDYRVALLAYWFNILLFGITLYASWTLALRAKLVRDDLSSQTVTAICHRILIAQALYAVGALLCLISTYLSMAVIILVQLNYALAPAQWFQKTVPSE